MLSSDMPDQDTVCQFPCPTLRQVQSEVRELEPRLGRVIDRWRDHLGGLILRTAAELKQAIGPIEADLRLVKLDVGELSGRLTALESDVGAERTTLSEMKLDQADVSAEVRRLRRVAWRQRAAGGAIGVAVGALPQLIETVVRLWK
jgi:hypothetical protein